jgi:peptide/nickel transport system permease protein
MVALVSLIWTPRDATHIIVPNRFALPGHDGYLLGADQFGRDILSMLMVGARSTLYVGIIAVGIALLIGVPLGGVAAVLRGRLEEVVMRASDVLFAFPAVLTAIMLGAVFNPSTLTAMVAIGIAYVPVFARVTRAATAQVMAQDFVLAARALGTSPARIFLRHVLRNIGSVIMVQATVAFALAILAEAALSYLGLGTPPPTPTWGRMLSDAQNYLTVAPRLALFPGLAIALSVLGFNLLGDGLRDLLDPKLRDRLS